jgi:sortase A
MENKIETSTQTQKKKNSPWGIAFLMILPFLLFTIGVSLISVFFFKEYIQTSSLWRFAINTNAVATTPEGENNNGEIIGTSMDDHSIVPVLPPSGSTENSTDTSEDTPDIPQTEQIYYDKKDFPGYRWGDLWAKLSIPAIGLEEKNVYVGESNTIYKKGIGKRFGTRFPGQGGNIVLGAHVTREFYDLSEMKIGDKVYITTGYGDYVYEVYETFIFSISDYKYVMNYDDGEKLTLYTCHPRGTAYRTERFGVLCKKVSGPEWIKMD